MPLLSYGWPPVNARHVAGSPTNAVDPSGQFLDVIVDVGFIVWDVVDIAVNGPNPENLGALGADVVSAFIPFATGGGLLVRGAAHADDVVRAVSHGNQATKASHLVSAGQADELIYRGGTTKESAGRLQRLSEESLANPTEQVFGVSATRDPTKLSMFGDAVCSQRRSVIEQHFPVHNTPSRRDPLHVTIELPNPVTPEAAKLFNQLFGRR